MVDVGIKPSDVKGDRTKFERWQQSGRFSPALFAKESIKPEDLASDNSWLMAIAMIYRMSQSQDLPLLNRNPQLLTLLESGDIPATFTPEMRSSLSQWGSTWVTGKKDLEQATALASGSAGVPITLAADLVPATATEAQREAVRFAEDVVIEVEGDVKAYNFWKQQGGFDHRIFENKSLKENTLEDNASWLKASAIIYKMEKENDLEDELSDSQITAASKGDFSTLTAEQRKELGEWGTKHMGWFNYNLANTAQNTLQITTSATDEQKLAFMYMLDAYDHKDQSWQGWGRALKGIVTDPTNLVGAGLIVKGAKTVGGQAVNMGIREAIKASMKHGLKIGAIDGALSAVADDAMRQKIEREGGRMSEYDWKRGLITTGIGTVAGGSIGGGTAAAPLARSWIARQLSKWFGSAADLPVPTTVIPEVPGMVPQMAQQAQGRPPVDPAAAQRQAEQLAEQARRQAEFNRTSGNQSNPSQQAQANAGGSNNGGRREPTLDTSGVDPNAPRSDGRVDPTMGPNPSDSIAFYDNQGRELLLGDIVEFDGREATFLSYNETAQGKFFSVRHPDGRIEQITDFSNGIISRTAREQNRPVMNISLRAQAERDIYQLTAGAGRAWYDNTINPAGTPGHVLTEVAQGGSLKIGDNTVIDMDDAVGGVFTRHVSIDGMSVADVTRLQNALKALGIDTDTRTRSSGERVLFTHGEGIKHFDAVFGSNVNPNAAAAAAGPAPTNAADNSRSGDGSIDWVDQPEFADAVPPRRPAAGDGAGGGGAVPPGSNGPNARPPELPPVGPVARFANMPVGLPEYAPGIDWQKWWSMRRINPFKFETYYKLFTDWTPTASYRIRSVGITRPVIESLDTQMQALGFVGRFDGGAMTKGSLQNLQDAVLATLKDGGDVGKIFNEFANNNRDALMHLRYSAQQLREHIKNTYDATNVSTRRFGLSDGGKNTADQKGALIAYLNHIDRQADDLLKGAQSQNAQEMIRNLGKIRNGELKADDFIHGATGLSRFIWDTNNAFSRLTNQNADGSGAVSNQWKRALERSIDVGYFNHHEFRRKPVTYAFLAAENIEQRWQNQGLDIFAARDEKGNMKIDYSTQVEAKNNFVNLVTYFYDNGFEHEAIFMTEQLRRLRQFWGGADSETHPNAATAKPLFDTKGSTTHKDDPGYGFFAADEVSLLNKENPGRHDTKWWGWYAKFFEDNRQNRFAAESNMYFLEYSDRWSGNKPWLGFLPPVSKPGRNTVLNTMINEPWGKLWRYALGAKSVETAKDLQWGVTVPNREKLVTVWRDPGKDGKGGESVFAIPRRIIVRSLSFGLVNDVSSLKVWQWPTKLGYAALAGLGLMGTGNLVESEILEGTGSVVYDTATAPTRMIWGAAANAVMGPSAEQPPAQPGATNPPPANPNGQQPPANQPPANQPPANPNGQQPPANQSPSLNQAPMSATPPAANTPPASDGDVWALPRTAWNAGRWSEFNDPNSSAGNVAGQFMSAAGSSMKGIFNGVTSWIGKLAKPGDKYADEWGPFALKMGGGLLAMWMAMGYISPKLANLPWIVRWPLKIIAVVALVMGGGKAVEFFINRSHPSGTTAAVQTTTPAAPAQPAPAQTAPAQTAPAQTPPATTPPATPPAGQTPAAQPIVRLDGQNVPYRQGNRPIVCSNGSVINSPCVPETATYTVNGVPMENFTDPERALAFSAEQDTLFTNPPGMTAQLDKNGNLNVSYDYGHSLQGSNGGFKPTALASATGIYIETGNSNRRHNPSRAPGFESYSADYGLETVAHTSPEVFIGGGRGGGRSLGIRQAEIAFEHQPTPGMNA